MNKAISAKILILALREYRQTVLLYKSNKFYKNKKIYSLELFNRLLKLSAVRKVPETIKFQALGIIESKTVWETVLAWAQKLKSEEAQYKLNTGYGLCQKDKFS